LAKAHVASASETDLRAGRTGQALSEWVPRFLRAKYEVRQPKAYQRYTDAWAALAIYLDEVSIAMASQVTKRLAKEYPLWRIKDHDGLNKVKWNSRTCRVSVFCGFGNLGSDNHH